MLYKEIAKDEVWLFCSSIKWCIFSLVAGVAVGSASSAFLYALEVSSEFVDSLGFWRFAVIFPGFLLSYIFVYIYTRGAKDDVIEAIHNDFGAVTLSAIPIRLAATIATIASGGSAGKESPCAKVGAGVMYSISKILNLEDADTQKMVIIGAAAGISAVFGTPISGAIFGVEILYVGQIVYDVLLPSVLAGIVSSMTAAFWGFGRLPSMPVAVPALASNMIFWSVAAGIFFGFVSLLHIECIHESKRRFKALDLPGPAKPLIGAGIMLLVSFVFGTRYMGLGEATMIQALSGENIPVLAFFLKSFTLAVTLGCGGSGGIILPTMFVGAAAGSLFARVLGLDMSVFSALGFIAVLAGSTNTPIASTLLAMELFGASISPFAGIACAAAYLLAGHRSLYSGQLMMRPKSGMFIHRKTAEGKDVIVGRYNAISFGRLAGFWLKKAKEALIKRKRDRRGLK